MRTMSLSLTLPLSLWLVLCFITGLTNAALEPTTEAVCQDNFGWMNNSRSQSPCLVAAYLEGACGTGYWNIPALPSGSTYDGPNENQTNLCLCSTVVYNAVSACGACQGEAWVTWPVWKLECDNTLITIANYKFDIPPGTAIPRWMYQDPTQQLGVSFNNTLAFSVAGQKLPDVTSSNQALPSGNTSAGTPTPTASTGSTNSANIGAIVGGVIGGIGFLTAGVILGWWFLRKRHGTRSSQAPSKLYIAKWSKEVPVGQAPSRGGGTSYGSDSVMGDPAKEKDMMMSPTSTLPASYPYPADGHKSPYDGRRRSRSFEGSPPQQPVMYYPTSPPSSYPAKRSRTQGHKKDHSGSSSFSRKLMGIPSTADNITPFYLPPVETTVTTDPDVSFSASRSDGRSSAAGYSAEQQSTRSRSTRPSRKQKTPVLAEPLPSTIEYFQNRPPPLANNNVGTAVPGAPPTVPYGRSSTEGNRSRTGSRSGYYNPDDPSTYPAAQMDPYGRPPSSRRTSADQLPGPAQVVAPTGWPDAASEKAALASRDYTPQTMPTAGHSGYAHSSSHEARGLSTSPPIPSTSPYGFRSPMDSPSQSPQPTHPLVGASFGLTNSVHTIQGFDEPDLEPEQALQHAPSGPVPQHQRQGSSGAESAGAGGNGFFSSIGRRVRPGGRSNESNNSQAAPTHGRQWSIHVRDSQIESDEFNPYRGS